MNEKPEQNEERRQQVRSRRNPVDRFGEEGMDREEKAGDGRRNAVPHERAGKKRYEHGVERMEQHVDEMVSERVEISRRVVQREREENEGAIVERVSGPERGREDLPDVVQPVDSFVSDDEKIIIEDEAVLNRGEVNGDRHDKNGGGKDRHPAGSNPTADTLHGRLPHQLIWMRPSQSPRRNWTRPINSEIRAMTVKPNCAPNAIMMIQTPKRAVTPNTPLCSTEKKK